jgi:cellulose synthase/poly-beta-1,6-N-acetylglucosamine synthase-like glycosyltransferase
MKLAVIIPCLNQFPITEQCLKFLSQEIPLSYELIVVDNGSDEEFGTDIKGVKVYRYDEPIGSYDMFYEALDVTDADIIALFHNDYFVYEKGWHKKVVAEFERDDKLGMIGFIGSSEIDSAGGRGSCTSSNFTRKMTVVTDNVGNVINSWEGSSAEEHGKRLLDFMYAAVLDGCVMILRRKALEEILNRKDFPPMHFYDRIISTDLLKKGWKIGVLGIESSHISGQTVNKEQRVKDSFREWAMKHNLNPGGIGTDWNSIIYKEAERIWLTEMRYEHFIPMKVDILGNIITDDKIFKRFSA